MAACCREGSAMTAWRRPVSYTHLDVYKRQGILSIKRILNQPGDEFDVDYNDTTFTAMVKIVDRALG